MTGKRVFLGKVVPGEYRVEQVADCGSHRLGRDGGIDSLCTSADRVGQSWRKVRAEPIPRPMNSVQRVMRKWNNAPLFGVWTGLEFVAEKNFGGSDATFI
jgi:hypothetical protein